MSRYRSILLSAALSRCLARLGEWSYLPGQSAMHLPRLQARRQMLDRYLKANDILHAYWQQSKAKRQRPFDSSSHYIGLAYLNKLLQERSDGRYAAEYEALVLAQQVLAPAPTPATRPVVSTTKKAKPKKQHGLMLAWSAPGRP